MKLQPFPPLASSLWRQLAIVSVIGTVAGAGAVAAPAQLDPTFGDSGRVTARIGAGDARSLALQSDGRIVIAGTTGVASGRQIAVARFNTNGTPDLSFNGTGVVTTIFGARPDVNAVAIQADGKILIAGATGVGGRTRLALLRYGTDGELDPALNGTGMVAGTDDHQTSAYSLAVQPDGKILVAGQTDDLSLGFVARFHPDGVPASTFNGTGMVKFGQQFHDPENPEVGATGVAVRSDGKILVVGYTSIGRNRGFLMRFDATGQLDSSLNRRGWVSLPLEASSIVLQSDGKILISGISYRVGLLVGRYRGNGTPDPRPDLAQKFKVVTNVRQCSVTDEIGIVSLSLDGERDEIKRSIAWLEELGVKVEPVEINTSEG